MNQQTQDDQYNQQDMQQNDRPLHGNQQAQQQQPFFGDERPLHGNQQGKQQFQQEPYQQQMEEYKQQNFNQGQNEHDEKVIPAIGKRPDENNPFGQNQLDDQGGQKQAEPLSQNARKLADPLLPVLGEELCRKIFSGTWQVREEGMKDLENEISHQQKIKSSDNNSIFAAIFGACANMVGDKIVQTMNTLQSLCGGKSASSKSSELSSYIDQTLAILLQKIGDSNQRVVKSAEETLFAMGSASIIGNQHVTTILSTGSVLKPKFQTSPKHLAARNSLLAQFVSKFKIGNKEVPLQPVVDFAVKCVQNNNRDVRRESINLIGTINQVIGVAKLRPMLEGIPQQQMDVIEDVLQGTPVDVALQGDAPKKGPQKQPSQKQQEQKIETNIKGGGGVGTGQEKTKKKENLQESKVKSKKDDDATKICEFCGKFDKEFIDSNKLDIHLWKECPLLTYCNDCAQLEECDQRKLYKKCPRCKEAVKNNQYQSHTEEMSCNQAKGQNAANRCPLCHEDVPPGIQGWKKHILQEGCPNNERSVV